MSIHRFWAPVEALVLGGVVELPEAAAHQIRRVLRLRPGNVISVFGGDGVEWKASLAEVGSRVMARLEGGERPDVELPEELELAVAVLKGEKLDWLVQKTTELGVTRIQLLWTERTVVSEREERWSARLARLHRIGCEAAEQSGRVRLPEILPPRRLQELPAGKPTGLRVCLDPHSAQGLGALVRGARGSVSLFCGPEGGFSAREAGWFREQQVAFASLGRRTLRAETAAVAGAALAAAGLEEREGRAER